VNWIWEVKIDGYRAIAVKSEDTVNLFSRTKNSFNSIFPYIRQARADLPPGTVVDGEVVAIDENGRPNFNLLQNFLTSASRIQYYVFDLVCLRNRDATKLPLIERRELLKTLSFEDKRIKIVDYNRSKLNRLNYSVRSGGKNSKGLKDSLYEPGRRTGAWIKASCESRAGVCRRRSFSRSARLRFSNRQLVRRRLMYVARTRDGFVPASRVCLHEA
jgi:ATP-dependent DNA ligase